MECSAKILRERTRFKDGKKETQLVFYCPILGELGFKGEYAERIKKNMEERLLKGNKKLFAREA